MQPDYTANLQAPHNPTNQENRNKRPKVCQNQEPQADSTSQVLDEEGLESLEALKQMLFGPEENQNMDSESIIRSYFTEEDLAGIGYDH